MFTDLEGNLLRSAPVAEPCIGIKMGQRYNLSSADVVLDLHAGIAGLALPEDTKHGMLHLDDEIAGLIEAADTAADQAGAPSAKPEPAASVPGEGSFV